VSQIDAEPASVNCRRRYTICREYAGKFTRSANWEIW
jgi:hypothetical protein